MSRAVLAAIAASTIAATTITARADVAPSRPRRPAPAAPAPPAPAALAAQIDALVAEHREPVALGVWFGAPGQPRYQRAADTAQPAASVIKSALLVELFAAHAGKLDGALAGADAILDDDRHPAIAPFAAAQRAELRAALRGATVRTVGAIMMGSQRASNAVYNAAANLAIAALGGPAAATAKIAARDPAFAGLVVRRYMLASRAASGDNDATPAALAAVLAGLAARSLPRVDDATAAAMVDVMLPARDRELGAQRFKDGNLDSDPMVVVKTGFYLRDGRPPVIYVISATLPARPARRDDARRQLDRLVDRVGAALRAAARP